MAFVCLMSKARINVCLFVCLLSKARINVCLLFGTATSSTRC